MGTYVLGYVETLLEKVLQGRAIMKAFKQHGVSLIEVLVAVLILATGLLGMMSLQGAGMYSSSSSHQRYQAVSMANEIVDRMSVNRAAVTDNQYDLAGVVVDDPGNDCTSSTSPCSEAQLAAADLFEWTTNLASMLPDGRAWITNDDGENQVTIVIGWNDDRNSASGTDCNNGLVCIEMDAEI